MEMETKSAKFVKNHWKGARRPKSRVYVWPDETLTENLINRRSRPVADFRRAAIKGLQELGVNTDSIKLSWRQTAGCSCGCSPGFICDGYDDKLFGNDAHIQLKKSS